MQEQRKVVRESFGQRKQEAFWSPRVERDGSLSAVTRMEKTQWYAVVDDIIEGTVVLQIASWPKLDKGNHLRFDKIFEKHYPLDALQKVINQGRDRHGQPAADRPLRTGDAFSIQCEKRPGKNIISSKFEGSILDITAAARKQAKIAMYGAVARKLSPDEAKEKDRLETTEKKKPDRFQRTVGAQKQMRLHSPGATAKPEI